MNTWTSPAEDALRAVFTVHADEALAVANETFDAAAEAWLRECVWPGCLRAKRGSAGHPADTIVAGNEL